jgi:hypothetical protein
MGNRLRRQAADTKFRRVVEFRREFLARTLRGGRHLVRFAAVLLAGFEEVFLAAGFAFTALFAAGLRFGFLSPIFDAFAPASPPTTAPTAAPRGLKSDPTAAPAAAPPAAFKLEAVAFILRFLRFSLLT